MTAIPHKTFNVLLIAGGLSIAGCAAHRPPSIGSLTNQKMPKMQGREKIVALEKALESKEAKVGTLETALAARDAKLKDEMEATRIAKMEAEQARMTAEKAKATAKAVQTASSAPTSEALLPPNAKPGACYARIFMPPQYGSESERVRVREAAFKIETIPARFETGEERVLVKAASERLEVVPATYKWVAENLLVKPASQEIQDVPPVYETVTERILDRPAHTIWKKGRGPIEQVNAATGEIMCLVDVPATYKTVTKRNLKTPATTRVIDIPAVYNTVKRRVMDTPPSTRKVTIPAEYSTVKVQKLVRAPQEKRIPIPEQFETVTKTIKLTEGQMVWRPILCETNITPDVVTDIQEALLKKGHNPGPIDGVLGTHTMEAVKAFQHDKGLAAGGLTTSTLKELGVKVGDAI